MDQGFTFPNRNQNNWDSDLNENFRKVERGHVFPGVVGPVTTTSGMLISFNNSGFVIPFSASNVHEPPDGVALQATSPGNTGYYAAWGSMNSFAPWSGQLTIGQPYYASVVSPGWVTQSLDQAGMHRLGMVIRQGAYTFQPTRRNEFYGTHIRSGIAHCASVALGYFDFTVFGGVNGICNHLRILSLSCDNYRATFFANSGRTSIIYDTAVLSGNLSVRTIDMDDSALWPYSVSNVGSMYGLLYGRIEVLSSAATAINSQAFQVRFVPNRER